MDVKIRKEKVLPLVLVMTLSFVFLALFFNAPTVFATSKKTLIPLPHYVEGTTYVYSNLTWEVVKKVEKGSVLWENYKGVQSSGSPDFTLRRMKWEGKKGKGERVYTPIKKILGKREKSLWPLKEGNEISYFEKTTWRFPDRKKKTYQSRWRYQVDGFQKITIKAGTFDTVKIVGKRFSIPWNNKSPQRLSEIKTWYYSFEFGHWILMTRKMQGKKKEKQIELLAIIPPYKNLNAVIQKTISKNFQTGLEKQPKNKSLIWNVSGQKAKGSITPKKTFSSPTKKYYRQYFQEMLLKGEKRKYFGLAFRNKNGIWTIPIR